jgi:hypothetical protein
MCRVIQNYICYAFMYVAFSARVLFHPDKVGVLLCVE